MLEQAAAAQWGVPVDQVEARNHEVVHKASGRRLGYGALAAGRRQADVPARETLKLKDPGAVPLHRQARHRADRRRGIVTGTTQYGIDTRLPGMLYAVVARPPVLGGKVKGSTPPRR